MGFLCPALRLGRAAGGLRGWMRAWTLLLLILNPDKRLTDSMSNVPMTATVAYGVQYCELSLEADGRCRQGAVYWIEEAPTLL